MADVILYLATGVGALAVLLSVLAFWTQPEKFGRLADFALMAFAALTLLGLITRGVTLSRVPLTGLYEFCVALAFALAAMALPLRRHLPGVLITMVLSLSAFLTLALAHTIPHSDDPIMPALKSVWLTAHVLTSIVAYASFGLAFVMALLYLTKAKGEGELAAHYDLVGHKSIVMGFIFQTLLLITGAVWAEEVWGSWWSWDPKETWALITWLIYAVALHGYRSRQWKGRKAAYFSIFGFAVVVFTMLGVTFLLPGMHSYF
ncbi:cytochrome c biogenesis protein CcsA [Peptococcus niger]|uniref:ABC-type transport system involved in cytochrome c biogenesis, permease component n=1 Tax=Peptococcus niger TaxID=2741 RepID=A0A1G6TIX3_PEPNI|nr:cytochrome c biogenesis protein CcsA [Peptococcus niger]SDD28991.1 ABC-type transport system involved in cytochrome c biogenesis, permease component [Peptococcus niger]